MHLKNNHDQIILVGRDRAHVRELAKKYPGQEVISASAFFDRVRILGFLTNQKTRDDHAPLIIAQRLLLENKKYSLRMAQNFSSLYSSFFHGTSSPKEVLAECAMMQLPVLEILAKMEEELDKKSLFNGVEALFHAWLAIKNKKLMPPGFFQVSKVCLFHLVDLTLLEIEVIKELSKLGLGFKIELPMDFMSRGINVAVDFCAKQFECEPDLNIELSFENISEGTKLSPLVNSLFTNEKISLGDECSIIVANDILKEADEISAHIASIISKDEKASIALALRSVDPRSLIYFRSLERHGLSVKGRKGQVLLESAAGILLSTIILARLNNLRKTDFVGLINHPLFIFRESAENCLKLQLLLEEIGIDDRLSMSVADRYQAQIEKLRPMAKNHHELLLEWLNKIEPLLLKIPLRDSFRNYLRVLVSIIEDAFEPLECVTLKESLSGMAQSQAFSDNDPHMSLSDFFKLLKMELKKITISSDHDQANAVEFLLLPELLGRSFDHVFIADITAGRMPKNQTADPLMDDQARMALNKAMKKPLLRIYFDDPFEPMPVPPRQALEPFWFASAVASAKKSVLFSYALRNDQSEEQAPSEFMVWLLNNDIKTKAKINFKTKTYKRFLSGILDKDVISDQSTAIKARKRAFLEQIPHELAFLVDENSIQESFLGRLGNPPTKALTPTMVEAFSGCRFKGFSERILQINKTNVDQDDVDARILGQIAHQVLEEFFDPKNKANLQEILAQVCKSFSQENFIKNELVFACHVEWLFEMLSSLVARLEEFSCNMGGEVLAREIDFGLSPNRLGAMVKAKGQSYLLGGRIDRIDRVGNSFLVFDYKLSSTDNLKALMAPRQMLNNHFQIPIYLRLVKDNLAKDQNVDFCLASIRDGELTFLKKDEHLLSRITDDNLEDSMAEKIHEIFMPIALGEVLANKGEHCTFCELAFFCRRDEQ
jgi:hypothetical protein